MKNKIIVNLNYIYSVYWIFAHNSNKYDYRERSKVHAWLMDKISSI